MSRIASVLGCAMLVVGPVGALAVDIPLQSSTKLVAIDKLAASGRAKVVFKAKGGSAILPSRPFPWKGSGVDPDVVAATLDLRFGSALGAFVIPAGVSDGVSGWQLNSEKKAVYRNAAAPAGPTQVKSAVIKPTKLMKLLAAGLGDTPLDLVPPDPANPPPLHVSYTVDDDGVPFRHCVTMGCTYQAIAGGTGSKLKCLPRDAVGDQDCKADDPCFVDLGATVFDACTGLEWEKKTGADDATPGDDVANPANLNDVDNQYSWAGRCSLDASIVCQPNAAAAAACAAQSSAGSLCDECPIAAGTCDVDPLLEGAVTTVWDWIVQLNAAGFNGHSDWRIPQPAFSLSNEPTAEGWELHAIIDRRFGNCLGPTFDGPCIDPVFGPTATDEFGPFWNKYWTAAAFAQGTLGVARNVTFSGGDSPQGDDSGEAHFVRAAR